MSAPEAISAAILTVGTEITTGEIVNRNSAWLAERLVAMGFSVHWHVSVPDDRPLIRQALSVLAGSARLIVVSGGLGPTSDDFTREEIAEWSGSKLSFSDSAWSDLEQVLAARGVQVLAAHRQQCEFPVGSKQLRNFVGTAHGFCLDAKGTRLVVLPGPPREIDGMWEKSVKPVLIELGPKPTERLRVWTLKGVPESQAADLTEKILAGSGLKIGYRASQGQVKVKVWLPLAEEKKYAPLMNALEKSLAPWCESSY